MDYCQSQVQTYDRDRYILTMAAPDTARPALWALYAFNHEIAKTREVTRDPNAGHVRLAWWRERLSDFYAGKEMPAHDVAKALGAAIRAHDLAQADFDALLDARAFDLEGQIPASLEGLADYAAATNQPLIQLSAKILGVSAPHHLGMAWGLTGLIRALPFAVSQNRCFLPLPMLHDIGLMPEQFHHLSPGPALSAAVQAIAARAQASLPAPSDPFFKLQAKMTAFYLKRMARAGHNPFDRRIYAPVPFLGLRILF